MQTTTKLELRPISELIPYARNARVHSDEQIRQLRASLREFGFVAPVLIDMHNNIISGHGRILAAEAEGVEQAPCVLVEHLTDTQRRAYILADNRLAEQASWDEELVRIELQELQDAGIDITITGFTADDVKLEDAVDPVDDAYEPELPVDPRSESGQIYQLGRHRLMCGDATVPADLSALMDGQQAHLLLTDPPYNVDYTGTNGKKLENDALSDEEYFDFLRRAFEGSFRHLEPGASYYIWHADGDPGRIVRNALHDVGIYVRQCLIWVKQRGILSRQDYHWQHEPCLHGQTGALVCGDTWDAHESCMYGWKDGKAHLWCSDRKQTTVLEFDAPAKSADHPTMKPVPLFAYQIVNSTRPDAAVLDIFAGSGTTAIACEQVGRVAYLMEADPRYVDVIIDRWERFAGQKAVLLNAT